MRKMYDNISYFRNIIDLRAEKYVRAAYDEFFYLKDNEKALQLVETALSFDERNLKGLLLKGDILFFMDKEEEALKAYETALKYYPESSRAHTQAAIVLEILGKKEQALFHCEFAFANINSDMIEFLPSLYNLKISILTEMKKFKEAKRLLDKAMKSLPEQYSDYLISYYKNIIETNLKKLEIKNNLKLIVNN